MGKGITINARIGVAMAFLAVLLAATSALGMIGMSRSNHALEDTFNGNMPAAVAIDKMEMYAARERLALDRAAFLLGTPEVAATLERARTMRSSAHDGWKRYLDIPHDANEDRLAQVVSARRDALYQAMDAFVAIVTANDRDKLVDGAKRLQATYNEMANAAAELRKFQFESSKQDYDASESTFNTFRIVGIVTLATGLIAAFLAWLTLRRAIARPLADALGHFDAIAAGDLRRPVVAHSRDEMGQIIDGIAKMQRSLVATVQSVRSGSDSIATATREIAAGNIDLSSRTEEQASALQQTAASMEELTGTVKQNAENARQASALAANASDIANKGSSVVGQVVGTMGEINQSSAKIADIITIIEGIAFQTNILALNAAVEAARAGEEGRGFAVVAGEVRSLAQRSSAAAKEIKELIDTSVERVQSGSALVDEAGRTMTEIIGAVQRVTDIMGEIAAASSEQSGGIDQVARAVAQMDEATQQNAALVEQAAAAAQSLEDQAQKLRTAVAVFDVEDAAIAADPSPGRTSAAVASLRRPAAPAVAQRAPQQSLQKAAYEGGHKRAQSGVQSAVHHESRGAPPSSAAPVPAPAGLSASATDQDWETF
ncbi:methyl-accepting chemotaxis protein [Paraburkholderia rhizosphaerae]|uniref:Methyl-accepting chemotaxis sensory transducer with TarH sensor n=1 Tax=Paraburkholderia rhizosphaerae TaxID=480658 RepID=A0A4R8L621_9BURK|nr:methyl-accepting chemotaxis protein [Paraburkholderia rhizosphaerae]TDY37785.1 methyl-accepting chemotaxis sensory transducer with TarH sensor [Paraburkholderia rhizosphaerae]